MIKLSGRLKLLDSIYLLYVKLVRIWFMASDEMSFEKVDGRTNDGSLAIL